MSPLPKYLLRDRGKKEKSQKQEERIAQKLNGKVQKCSGALPGHKGDVRTPDLLVEAKRTDKDSLSVKKEWLVKISKEAIAYNKVPALSIEFDKMPPLVDRDWVAVPAKFLRMLIDVYERMIEEDERSGSGSA